MGSKPPYGYIRDEITHKLVPHHEQSEFIKLIYNLFVNKNFNLNQIKNFLEGENIPSPSGKFYWNHYQIKRCLQNPVYKGTIMFRTTEVIKKKRVIRPEEEHIIVENAHEVLVDEDTWEEAQERLESREIKRVGFLATHDSYELSGICRCSKCGKKLKINKMKRKMVNDTYYNMVLRCHNNCMNVKYEVVEDALLNVINEFVHLDNENLMEMLNTEKQKDMIKKSKEIKSIEDIKKSYEAKLKNLDRKLNVVFDQFFNNTLTEENYKIIVDKINRDKIELQKLLTFEEVVNEEEQEVMINQYKNQLISLIDLYNTSQSVDEKNKILTSIFKDVDVHILEKGKKGSNPKVKLIPQLRINLLQIKKAN